MQNEYRYKTDFNFVAIPVQQRAVVYISIACKTKNTIKEQQTNKNTLKID